MNPVPEPLAKTPSEQERKIIHLQPENQVQRTMEILGDTDLTPLQTQYILDAVWLGQVGAAERHQVSASTITTICHRHRELYQLLREQRHNMAEATLEAICALAGQRAVQYLAKLRGAPESVLDAREELRLARDASAILDQMQARRERANSQPKRLVAAEAPPELDAILASTPAHHE